LRIRSTKRRGFTVMEMMIVIMLMAICFTVISQIIFDYSKSMRYIKEKENVLFGIQMGIHRIADELREANEVIIPANVWDSDNKVVFKRRDQPFLPTDYEADTGKHDYGLFLKNPRDENPCQTIKYVVESEKLCRKILDDDGNEISNSILIQNVNSLNVTKKDNGEFEISITIQENKALSIIKTTVQVRSRI